MRRLSAKPQPARRGKPQRRRPLSPWLRKARPIGLAIGFLAPIGFGLYWLVASGFALAWLTQAEDRALLATAQSGLALASVEIEGRSETAPEDVLSALGAPRGAPLLGIDLEAARERLVALPWVTDAVVERRLPDRLVVQLSEAQALALWQREGRYHLIGRNGEIIAIDDIAPFRHLLLLVGADAPAQAARLLDWLGRTPDLKARVKAAILVNGRRWSLRMDNGIDIKLPEDDPAAAWARFAALEAEHGLLEKDLAIIDLRQKDKLIVRLAHPAGGDADGDGKPDAGDAEAPKKNNET